MAAVGGPAAPRSGVTLARRFIGAQRPERVREVCVSRPAELLIEDQYCRRYTAEQFLAAIESCPIHLASTIGRWFV